MKHRILTPNQTAFLDCFTQNEFLRNRFYLTGGTALSAFHLPYRYSEDLDFFSETEINVGELTTWVKSIQKQLGFTRFEYNTSFNRNLFFLKFRAEELKIEFTYFPFPQIEKPKLFKSIPVDSPTDIAVNKIFTIYQQPRLRDYLDLYMLCHKYDYQIPELLHLAKIKFDWHMDPIKLGAQFLAFENLHDFPRLIRKIPSKNWQEFFTSHARIIGEGIIKQT